MIDWRGSCLSMLRLLPAAGRVGLQRRDYPMDGRYWQDYFDLEGGPYPRAYRLLDGPLVAC